MKKFLIIGGILFFLFILLNVAGHYNFRFFEDKKGNSVAYGRTYIVKAADGSGKVKMYNLSGFSAGTIPDGTEVLTTSGLREGNINRVEVDNVEVKYNGQQYAIAIEDFSEETAKSIAARTEKKNAENKNDARELAKGIILLVFLAGAIIEIGHYTRRQMILI